MRDSRAVRAKADELLDLVHLEPERVLRAYAHELSGGMKQRVLIALSLLLGPRLLILDEPTTALDILTQRAIIDLLRDLRTKLGFAMVFISHDLSLAAELADRVLTMYAGRIVEEARVGDLFYRPRHPYTVGLLRAVPRVSGEVGKLARKLVGLVVLDVEMHGLLHGRDLYNFYHRCKASLGGLRWHLSRR